VSVLSVWEKIDKVRHWHARLTDCSWLHPAKPKKLFILLILISGLMAAGMNGYVRYWQYDVWKQNSQIFYLDDGTPLFTTTDSSYFLGAAQAIKQDKNVQTFSKKRQYSGIKKAFEQDPPKPSLRDAPLLSVVLSIMAEDSSVKALLSAGNNLIPITAIFTALMIILSFGAAGYWLEGSIAAAGGGLSMAYLPRSGAGRIDTDQLNLGFFYFMTGLVIWAARVKSQRAALVLAALAGAIFWLYDWWYSKPFFGWAAFIGFIWLSFVCRRNIKLLVLQSLLFLGLSGLPLMGLGISANSSYLVDTHSYEGLIFPNTLDTITETLSVPFSEILIRLSGSVWLGGLSVLGLGLWAIRHPALAIVFGPAAAFALLNFVIGNRAIFYSAPMLWFGFGWILLCLSRYSETKITISYLRPVSPLIAMIIGFVSVWIASPTSYVQSPTFDKSTVSHFQKLDTILPKADVAIASWWDYGYLSMFVNGRPTLHDGGSSSTPTTYFIANNLIQNSQKQAALELDILGNSGFKGVIQNRLGEVQKSSDSTTEIYLVLTENMTRWMSSISKIGAFDIKAGRPYQFDGVKPNYQLGYQELTCQPTSIVQEFLCNGDKLNLVSGTIGNRAILYGVVISKNGQRTNGRQFSNANTPFILHSEIGTKATRNVLIHRDLYFSVFHQLYYLNQPNPKYFELVYDGFPKMRVFKIL
jgi:dolichyl-diphosphooligosaccharide--protein glycosyltransferase